MLRIILAGLAESLRFYIDRLNRGGNRQYTHKHLMPPTDDMIVMRVANRTLQRKSGHMIKKLPTGGSGDKKYRFSMPFLCTICVQFHELSSMEVKGLCHQKCTIAFGIYFLMPIPLVQSFLWWGGSSHGLGGRVPSRLATHIPSSVRGLV